MKKLVFLLTVLSLPAHVSLTQAPLAAVEETTGTTVGQAGMKIKFHRNSAETFAEIHSFVKDLHDGCSR